MQPFYKAFKRFIIGLSLCIVIADVSAEQAHAEIELRHFHNSDALKLSDLKGRVIYLDFWASWCKPCKKSFPFMNQLHQTYPPEHFKVIAINLDEFPEDAQKFLNALPAQFDIYTDPQKQLVDILKLPGLPVAYIIDREGNIKGRHIGFNERKKDKKIKQIEYLIGQP